MSGARLWLPSLVLLATAPASAQLGTSHGQGWNAAHPELETEAQAGAALGHVVAAGDFNGDGFDDLATGVPRRIVSFNANAGEVLVLYGSAAGLAAAGHQLWNQDSPGVSGVAEVGDFFGAALAAGDFDGDGFDDLAIGVPGEAVVANAGAGAVQVLPGGPAGLSSVGDGLFHQDTPGIDDASEAGDSFGFTLATGDFDEDGDDDLAVGVPNEDLEGVPAYADLGALHVLFGTPLGLDLAGARFYRPGEGVFAGLSREDDLAFAAALAAGPLSNNGQDQIAIGMPGATIGVAIGAGAVVSLIHPAGGGVMTDYLTQDTLGVPGVAESGDAFGAALAIGRFAGNFAGALVVGSPGEDIESEAATDAGAFHVFDDLKSGNPLATLWTQEDVAFLASESGDGFGFAFAVGDFDADGLDDLAVGTPGEDLGDGGRNSGGFGLDPIDGRDERARGPSGESLGAGIDFGSGLVLYGDADLVLNPAGAQILPLGVVLVESDLDLGWSLAAGRFSGHSGADLAISLPRADVEDQANAGSVWVIASIALFRDGFASGDTSAWSDAQP
jgi:hypothetical protein